MRYLYALGLVTLTLPQIALAESTLLESVKRNPNEALSLCQHFKSLNSKGISAGSPEAIKQIANKRNLTTIDAEILSTYVIGMNCPDVR